MEYFEQYVSRRKEVLRKKGDFVLYLSGTEVKVSYSKGFFDLGGGDMVSIDDINGELFATIFNKWINKIFVKKLMDKFDLKYRGYGSNRLYRDFGDSPDLREIYKVYNKIRKYCDKNGVILSTPLLGTLEHLHFTSVILEVNLF